MKNAMPIGIDTVSFSLPVETVHLDALPRVSNSKRRFRRHPGREVHLGSGFTAVEGYRRGDQRSLSVSGELPKLVYGHNAVSLPLADVEDCLFGRVVPLVQSAASGIQWSATSLSRLDVVADLATDEEGLRESLYGIVGLLTPVKADVQMNRSSSGRPTVVLGNKSGHVRAYDLVARNLRRRGLAAEVAGTLAPTLRVEVSSRTSWLRRDGLRDLNDLVEQPDVVARHFRGRVAWARLDKAMLRSVPAVLRALDDVFADVGASGLAQDRTVGHLVRRETGRAVVGDASPTTRRHERMLGARGFTIAVGQVFPTSDTTVTLDFEAGRVRVSPLESR